MDEEWLSELQTQVKMREAPWVVLEGRELVEAALAGWWDLHGVLVDENSEWDPPLWSGLDFLRGPSQLLEDISGGSDHGGVLALARQPDETADVAGLVGELEQQALLVVCPKLGDAAEVGAVVRHAAAMGAQAVLFGSEGASPFEGAALRAAGGGLFQLPLRVADSGQIWRCLKAGGFKMAGAEAGADIGPPSLMGAERLALVLASECEGLGSFWKSACDQLVGLPPDDSANSVSSLIKPLLADRALYLVSKK